MITAFNKRCLATHCDSRRIRDNTTKVVPVSFYTNPANVTKLEDKVIHIRVLTCITSGGDAAKSVRVTYNSQFSQNKKPKYGEKLYTRLLIVADLANPPNCAAIIIRNGDVLSAIFKQNRGKNFVGKDYVLVEPGITKQFLGTYMPIITLGARPHLLPLRSGEPLTSTYDSMTFPKEVGKTKFFCLTKSTVRLTRLDVPNDMCCTGVMCDRQKPASKGGCSCYVTTKTNTYIFCFDVTFAVPVSFEQSGQVTVEQFRSLALTEVFFHNLSDFTTTISDEQLLDHLPLVRDKVDQLVDYVNSTDGWDLIGWVQLGSVIDAASDSQKEKVDNAAFTIHLCHLRPHEYDKRDSYKDIPGFKSRQIKTLGNIPTSRTKGNTRTTGDDDDDSGPSSKDPSKNDEIEDSDDDGDC